MRQELLKLYRISFFIQFCKGMCQEFTDFWHIPFLFLNGRRCKEREKRQ